MPSTPRLLAKTMATRFRVPSARAPEAAAPALTDADQRTIRRTLGLRDASRVGFFGRPTWYLPTLEAALPAGARLFDERTPGRGALDAVVYFAEGWSDKDTKLLARRVADGAQLSFVWRKASMKPAVVAHYLTAAGFTPRGRPRPVPAGRDGWVMQVFDRSRTDRKAAPKKAAPKKTAPRKAAPKKAAPKKAAPKKAVLAERGHPPEEPLAKRIWKLGRPVSFVASTRQLRSSEPTSAFGPVTWAAPGEAWPSDGDEPFEHLVGVRVDELPVVPKPLEALAYVSVFAAPQGPLVRAYESLDGLTKLRTRGRPGRGRAIRWGAAFDYPDDYTAYEVLDSKRVPAELSSIEAARMSHVLDHVDGPKVGGWPSTLQHPAKTSGFVMQLGWIEGICHVHRVRRRWLSSIDID